MLSRFLRVYHRDSAERKIAKLTWKETLIPFDLHKNPSYNGDAFWAIQEGKWSYFDGKTIEQVAEHLPNLTHLSLDGNPKLLETIDPEFFKRDHSKLAH